MTDKWYIVRNGEILYTVGTDEEMQEIMEQDKTGELEAYPREAYIGRNQEIQEILEISEIIGVRGISRKVSLYKTRGH